MRLGFGLSGLIFALGSLVAATAMTMPVLILGRIMQGAGGGMLFTLCYSMIIVVYPERLWSRAMALLSGTWGITMLFGWAGGDDGLLCIARRRDPNVCQLGRPPDAGDFVCPYRSWGRA